LDVVVQACACKQKLEQTSTLVINLWLYALSVRAEVDICTIRTHVD